MALPLPLGGFFSAFSKAYVSFGAGAGTKSRRSSALLVSQQCLGDTRVGMTEVPQHWEISLSYRWCGKEHQHFCLQRATLQCVLIQQILWCLQVGFHTCEVDQVGAVPRDPEPSTQAQKDFFFFSFLVAVDRLIAGKLSCGRSSNFLNPTRPQHRSLYSSRSNRASFFPDHLPGTLSQPHAAAACWPCCPLPHLGCR